MPIAVRIVLFTLLAPCATLFALLTLAQSLISNFHPLASTQSAQPLSLVLGLLTLLCGLPLLFLDVGNKSPGAIDNASGVGVALHLAQCLSRRSDITSKVRLTLLFTSAEELALMGAIYHVERNLESLKRDAQGGGLYVLNLDSTGVDGNLCVVGGAKHPAGSQPAGRLLDMVRRASSDLGVPLRRFPPTGVLFDHIPFAERGFDAASLLTIGGAAWVVHTADDTLEKLHPRGFEMAGRVAMRVIEGIAYSV